MLTGLRYFDIYKDDKSPIQPTSVEIENLFTYGNFISQRLFSTFPKPEYVLPRSRMLDQGVKALSLNKTLIIHSKIGNGKSAFRNCLSTKLTELHYSCFECRDNVTIPNRDIELLKLQDKPVIMFSSFDTAYACMHLFSDLPEATRFIIEMNTGTLQVRRGEVLDTLFGPVERLDVNCLDSSDIKELDVLLDKAGIAPPQI